MKQRPPSSSGSTSSAGAMGNGGSYGRQAGRSLNGLHKRKSGGYAFRSVILALLVVAMALAAMALNLAAQIKESTDANTNIQESGSGVAAAASASQEVNSAKSDDISPPAPASDANEEMQHKMIYPSAPKDDPKYAKDRVYCMVPFIWNKEIYDVIMSTWGEELLP